MKKIILMTILALLVNCSAFTSSKSDDKTPLLAAYYLLNSSSSSYSTTCTSSFGTGVADFISKTFTCVTVTVSGANYVFKTSSIPTYKSYYWGSTSSGYESTLYSNTTGSNYGNPNLIISQAYTITVPITNTTTTAPTSSFGAIGVATNGIVLYNDQAAPGDSLTSEYYTFDTSQGHPTNTGSYHYHVEPPKISNTDSALVGIAMDGYLIFGKLHDTTSTGLTTGFTLGGSTSTTKCTGGSSTTLPTTWTYKSNYETNTSHTAGTNEYHYHINNGSEVNGIILSGKLIGTAGTSI
jgi:hypothetical protein